MRLLIFIALLFIVQLCTACKSSFGICDQDYDKLIDKWVSNFKTEDKFLIDKRGALQIIDVETHKPQVIIYAIHQSPANAKGAIAVIRGTSNTISESLCLNGMIDFKVIQLHSINASCIIATIINEYGPGHLKSEYIAYTIKRGRLVKCLEVGGDEHSEHELSAKETEIGVSANMDADIKYIIWQMSFKNTQNFGINNGITNCVKTYYFKYNSRSRYFATNIVSNNLQH